MDSEIYQNLRKQLAVAVTSIQWSYSIFWSISSSDPRVLEWSEGYYNGDIKTRKTVQAVEFDVNQLGLQRSEQLRELYESLLAGEANPQAKRPSAALSPEDLSNTEWYYLVCMSFVFNLGQDLPGKTLENGQPFWLCNAHQADSKAFSRSLLAKSASIQTVVCFPFLGGVVELGVTDMIPEDFSLIQNVQASLLEIDHSALLDGPNSFIHLDNDAILETELPPIVQDEDLRLFEPSEDCFGLMQSVEEADFLIEDVNEDLMDDEPSSECISLAKTENVEEIPHPQRHENPDGSCLVRMESDTQHQWIDDLHYQNVLVALSNNKPELTLGPFAGNCNKSSSFSSWKRSNTNSYQNPRNGYGQRMLKKLLIEVPSMMHKDSSLELASSRVLAERRRREGVNDKFSALKSLIPSLNKVDKVSILDDTIKHMKELQRRVEELETKSVSGHMKPQDMAERTSDNYKTNRTGFKRKSSEEKLENSLVSLRDRSTKTDLSISLIQKDVLVEITCPWKECLLLEIIDALSTIRLDTHSVQSSTSDSFLSVTVKAQIKEPGHLSAGVIRQVLQRVLMKSG